MSMQKFKKAAQIILAEIPLLILFLPKGRPGAAAAAGICVLLFLFLYRRQKNGYASLTFEKTAVILLLSMLSGVSFYTRWQNTARMKDLASLFVLPPKQICALAAVLLCLGFCFSLSFLQQFFRIPPASGKREAFWDALYVLLLAVTVITLVSRNSPFYPFNEWRDANTMFTVGKGMLRGAVPYRDLYEHKGPYISALHALSALISFDSLRGVWLLEIAACFFTLWFMYKMIRFRLGRKALAALPLAALAVYTAWAFEAGDSAEEMSLPLLTFALYTGVKAIRENTFPSDKECFLIGLTSGCILWMKYTHLGFYGGWFLYFALRAFSEKKADVLPKMLLRILAGVAAAAVPVFLYFGLNRAIAVFLESYFLNNLHFYPTLYSAEGPFRHAVNLWRAVVRFREVAPASLFCTAAGLLWCFTHRWIKTGLFLTLTLLSGFTVMFVSGVSFPYYFLLYGCFAVFGVMWLWEIRPLAGLGLPLCAVLWLFLCAGGCLLLSPNLYVLKFSRDDFPYYKLRDMIESSGIEDPDILHYGLLDAGFNLPTALVPKQRFFCAYNLKWPEMEAEMDRYLENAVTDFVVTCHEPLYNADKYQLIATCPGDFTPEGGSSLFFLYQRAEDIR